MKELLIFLAIIFVGGGLLIGGAIFNWLLVLEFEREIEGFFDYADRSSDALTKLDYFNKFIAGIEKHGLTTGKNSMFFQEQPKSSLDDNFKVAKSLQARLEAVSKLDPQSFEYSNNMNQITLQEFCWFPISVFEQGYLLKKGGWGWAFFPPDVQNRCITKTTSSGYNMVYDFLD